LAEREPSFVVGTDGLVKQSPVAEAHLGAAVSEERHQGLQFGARECFGDERPSRSRRARTAAPCRYRPPGCAGGVRSDASFQGRRLLWSLGGRRKRTGPLLRGWLGERGCWAALPWVGRPGATRSRQRRGAARDVVATAMSRGRDAVATLARHCRGRCGRALMACDPAFGGAWGLCQFRIAASLT
jgi:hypothetical protein